MIIRAAVLPTPPLLVPELVTGAAAETEGVRAACLDVARQLSQRSRRWIAVATHEHRSAEDGVADPVTVGPDAVGTFRGFGVDVPVGLSARAHGEPDVRMPLPALVAGWLRARAGADEVTVRLVPSDATGEACRAVGRRLAAAERDGEPCGLLVLGDGSFRHGERAPGRPDGRAEGFDRRVRAALAAADPAALRALDARLATELGAVGWAAWQVLAGVLEATGTGWRCVSCEMMVPFGVAYHLAVLDPE